MPNGNGHPSQSLTLPHWRYPTKLKGLSGIYLNTASRYLGNGLIGIFIPIYIYRITGNFAHVFLFYAFFRFFALVTIWPVARLISKIGPDASMLVSSFTRSIYLILLTLTEFYPLLLWLAPIFGGITIPLYWLPYHNAFSSESKDEKLPTQVAKVANITRLITVASPLIGGFIADKLGFHTLFPTGIALLVVSALPIFFDEYDKEKIDHFPKELEKEVFPIKDKDLFFSFFFQGFQDMAGAIAWPLIIYIFIPDLEEIGGLTTFSLLISLFVVKWLSKKIKKFKIFPFTSGNIVRAVVWVIRAIANNHLVMALTDPLIQIASVFTQLPTSILVYQLGKDKSLSFFIERETALHLGSICVCLIIFFLLFFQFPWQIISVITITGITIRTICLMRFEKNSKES